jgi:hypothetical protein
VLSEKKILNETKNHNLPLQVKWSVPNVVLRARFEFTKFVMIGTDLIGSYKYNLVPYDDVFDGPNIIHNIFIIFATELRLSIYFSIKLIKINVSDTSKH